MGGKWKAHRGDPERTSYSKNIAGAKGNYDWSVKFDRTGGFIGITQLDGARVKDRVLLSPKQMSELMAFAGTITAS